MKCLQVSIVNRLGEDYSKSGPGVDRSEPHDKPPAAKRTFDVTAWRRYTRLCPIQLSAARQRDRERQRERQTETDRERETERQTDGRTDNRKANHIYLNQIYVYSFSIITLKNVRNKAAFSHRVMGLG